MAKKMGRPTSNPKTVRIDIRLSEQENELLKACMEKTGLTKTDTVIKGLELLMAQSDSPAE